ncbi:MAG: PAS domain S-box protein [Ignavibacteriaceae bacterium]|nr:PAS domain S-box protein [Ignavibacteriaceae bacterium]
MSSNLINRKALIVSVILGCFAFVLIYAKIYFTIPGTNLLTDPREILVTIGAALTGPIGAVIISILSSIYDPTGELVIYIILQHIIGAVLVAYCYKKYIYGKLSILLLIPAWILLIFSYYFIFYIPLFASVYFAFPEFYNLIVKGNHEFFPALIKIYKGWIPEFLITSFITSLILIALPAKYNKPLWGISISPQNMKNSSVDKFFAAAPILKNFLAIRLVLWFILLAIIPILFLGVSIKNTVAKSILEHEAIIKKNMASEYRYRFDNSSLHEANIFFDKAKNTFKGSFAVLDKNGDFYIPPKEEVLKKSAKDYYGVSLIDELINQNEGIFIDIDNKVSYGFSQLSLDGNPYFIIFSSNTERVNSLVASFETSVYNKLIFGILVISIVLIISVWFFIKRPLSVLSEALEKFGDGNYNVRLREDEFYYEFKLLANSFNDLSSKIKSTTKNLEDEIELRKSIEIELRENEERLKLAFEAASDGVWDWNIRTNEVYFSPQWKKMIGYEDDEIQNNFEEWQNKLHPEDMHRVFTHIEKHFSSNSSNYEIEHRLRCKDGKYKWILARGKVLERDESGKPLRMIGTHSDIDERKKNELLQSVIREIDNSSIVSDSLTDLINKLKLILAELFISDSLLLTLYDSVNGNLEILMSDNYEASFTDFDELLAKKLIEERVPKIFSKDDLSLLFPTLNTKIPINSILGTTFQLDSNQLGILILKKTNSDKNFSEVDVEILAVLTNHISSAIIKKKSEEALHESEERFKKLFDDSFDPIILLKDGKFIEYNRAALSILGYEDKKSLIGKTPFELSPEYQPDGRLSSEKAVEMINIALRNGNHLFEWVHIDNQFNEFFVEVALAPISIKGEELIHVTWRDLTLRKAAEEALRESEKKYREMTDLLPQTVFETDLSGRFTFLNKSSFKIFGFDDINFREGLNVFDVLHESSKQKAKENIKSILNGKVSGGNDYLGVKKDGTVFPILIYSSPIIENKKPVGLRGIVIDVSESKKAEEEIRIAKAELQNVLEAASEVSIIATDKSGIIKIFNSGAEKLIGYNGSEVINKFSPVLFHKSEELKEKVKEIKVKYNSEVNDFESLIHVARLSGSDTFECTYIRKDGNEVRVNLVVTSVKAANGEITGYLGIATDISNEYKIKQQLILSEDKFRNIVHGLNDGIVIIDANATLTYVSPSCEKIFGYTPDEMIGKNAFSFMNEDDVEFMKSELITIINKENDGVPTLFRAKKKNGASIYVDAQGKNHFDTPAIKGIVVFIRDVNEEVIAKNLLQESEARYRLTIEQTGQLVYDIDLSNREVIWSGPIESITGYHENEFLTDSQNRWESILHTDDKEPTSEFFESAIRKGGNYSTQYRIVRKTGEIVYIEDTGIVIENENKVPIRMLGAVKDITLRMQALEEINQSSENFNTIFRKSPIPQVITYVGNSIIAEVNKAYTELTGRTREEVVGKTSMYFLDDVMEQRLREVFERDGQVDNYEIEYSNPDGSSHVSLFSSIVINFNKKLATLTTIKDITQIRNAEQKLKSAFEYIQYVVDSITTSIISFNSDLIITHFNKAAESFRIDSSVKSGPIFEVFPKLKFIREDIDMAMTENDSVMNSRMVIDENSDTHYYSIAIFPLKSSIDNDFVIMVEDTTEKTRFSEMMIQSEKMITVAGLAAGMAHEINNPLGTIVQGCQNIMRRVSSNIPKNVETAENLGVDIKKFEDYFKERQIFDIIDSMRTAAGKASDIIKNMLQFSRRSESKKVEAQLSKIIDESIELAYNDYDLKKRYDFRSFEVLKEIEHNLPVLSITITEIEQVLFNIIKNAAQAIANEHDSQKRPKLIIRAAKEDRFVRIEIEDNGPGIPEKVKNRIFEPFFTTKDVGEGTGLGLSVSYMIIRDNHQGELYCESKLGLGTKFIIKLPIQKKRMN